MNAIIKLLVLKQKYIICFYAYALNILEVDLFVYIAYSGRPYFFSIHITSEFQARSN